MLTNEKTNQKNCCNFLKTEYNTIQRTPVTQQTIPSAPIPQNSNKNDSRIIYPSTPVIQRIGERAAVRRTMLLRGQTFEDKDDKFTNGIRRGNRRGSIQSTEGESYYKISIVREIANQIVAQYRIEYPESYVLTDDEQIKAEVYLEAGVGNCGEFATITYAHILANTNRQWVYICSIKNVDHAFTVTSPTSLTEANPNYNYANVVDAWDDYKIMPLRTFLEIYDSEFKELKFEKSHRAGIANQFTPAQVSRICNLTNQKLEQRKNEIERKRLVEIEIPDFLNRHDDVLYGNEEPLVREIQDMRDLSDQVLDIDEDTVEIAVTLLQFKLQKNISDFLSLTKDFDQNLMTSIVTALSKDILNTFSAKELAYLFSKTKNLPFKIKYIESLTGWFGTSGNNMMRICTILFYPGNEDLRSKLEYMIINYKKHLEPEFFEGDNLKWMMQPMQPLPKFDKMRSNKDLKKLLLKNLENKLEEEEEKK